MFVKRNMTGELATSLLRPELRARFFQLFEVAARKSVFLWREAALPLAQVVVLDASSDVSRLQMWPPCVIWVGVERPDARGPGVWAGRLALDYTVADLIDVLDRAAVFLLDWKARQRQSPVGATASPVADTSAGPLVTVQSTHYRLKEWVFLDPPFDEPGCLRALALLTRQPVTAQQLQQHSGLGTPMVMALLQELARRRVLLSSVGAPVAAPVVRQGAVAPKGFIRRLSRWLRGEGRA